MSSCTAENCICKTPKRINIGIWDGMKYNLDDAWRLAVWPLMQPPPTSVRVDRSVINYFKEMNE